MTTTDAKWAERIRQWKESGKTAEEFATGQPFVTGGPSEIHFQRRSGDPVIHLAAGWLGPGAKNSAGASNSG